jgi:ABC-type dipeptide/oligopeptide/nickel transport system permease component
MGRPSDRVLPAATLGIVYAAYVARLTRGGMLEVLHQDFIRTARAKGASEFRVIFRHALRGGLLPVVSFLGPAVAGILTGSFVIETIFQIPGIGREFVNSAFNRDYTLVLGTVILYAVAHHHPQPRSSTSRRSGSTRSSSSNPELAMSPSEPLPRRRLAHARASSKRATPSGTTPGTASARTNSPSSAAPCSPSPSSACLRPASLPSPTRNRTSTSAPPRPRSRTGSAPTPSAATSSCRLLYGGRISIMVGLAATFVALTIGVVYGAVAGFFGGKIDSVMMRIVDIMYSMPFTIFVILLMVFFGRNIILLFVAIGAVEWLTMARIVRGQILSIKRMEFIEAARSLGLGRAASSSGT